jgi:hypothetical protein
MTQILDSLSVEPERKILCGYKNQTDSVQIVRIANVPEWYFERVVFPGEFIMFHSLPEASLEVHSNSTASAVLSDRIPCEKLEIAEEGSQQQAANLN